MASPKTCNSDTPNSPDPRIPVAKEGYPWHLSTGQKITWVKHESNGTQVITLAANGRPPFSADHALTLIAQLKKEGLDPKTWYCSCYEINQDSRKWHVDGNFSVQVIEGLLLKIYAHGYNTRIEIANRRKTSMKEVNDLLHCMVKGVDTQGMIREMDARDKQYTEGITRADARSRYTYSALTEVKNELQALRDEIRAASELQRGRLP